MGGADVQAAKGFEKITEFGPTGRLGVRAVTWQDKLQYSDITTSIRDWLSFFKARPLEMMPNYILIPEGQRSRAARALGMASAL